MTKPNPKAAFLINQYIASLPNWSRIICQKLRQIIRNTNPDIIEDWKWGSPAFSYNNTLLCWFWAYSKHINFFFYQGALMKDSKKLFNYGKGNLRNRSIKFTQISQIDQSALIDYIREAIELNKAGKHIKISTSKDKTVVIPAHIEKILKGEGLLEKFNELIYTYHKGYIRWIAEAKRKETKQKRINQMLSELHQGKKYMNIPIKI